MFNVVEMTTARVIAECSSVDEAISIIENIEQHSEYATLLSEYGSLRRVQQEITIEQNI